MSLDIHHGCIWLHVTRQTHHHMLFKKRLIETISRLEFLLKRWVLKYRLCKTHIHYITWYIGTIYISFTLSNMHVQQNNTHSSVSIMQFNTSVISRGNDSIEVRKSSLNTCEHLIIWRIRFYQRQLWFATDGVQNSSSVYIIEQHWNANTWFTKLPCENGSPMPYSDGLHPL